MQTSHSASSRVPSVPTETSPEESTICRLFLRPVRQKRCHISSSMAEDEVLYETRLHISRPYTSNYPPLLHSNKVNQGGFLSIIKEKWSDYRNYNSKSSTEVRKNLSLFISPRGDYVAVASANQITILSKENDYQQPHGTFTCRGGGVFTSGVWSEFHGVLGVVDDSDTVYLIKVNGEEIMRIGKRQLRASSSIVGLIPQDADDNDAQRSCLCRFVVITADGCLQLIEMSKEPSASVLNRGLKSLGKFPKDVFCSDYSSECSLLVVVGSAVGISQLSIENSAGSCLLSLWCRSRNLDLEPLISIQFKGLYSKSKDAILSCPKVLISPQGKFVATLDITGRLHIFKMDKESRSLVSFACEEQLRSQGTSNRTNGQNELLNDIVDFTWWSDRIMTLAKRGGILAMLDIVTGLKFQEHNHLYSMLVLDRIQQFQGRIFALDSKVPSKPHRESDNVYNVERVTGGRSDQLDVSQLHWSLISLSKRSVPEMYNILISNCKYQAALDFANHHGLDRDEILKSQWLHSSQGKDGINMFLSNIKDRSFVLSECVDKVGPTEDAVKALLSYGLQVTDQFRFSESEADEGSQIWDFRMARLQLLQFRDRLETYMGINMGRFSVQEFRKFRIILVGEAAITLAESGKIGALNLLFKRHPYSLSPSLLKILAAIPETVPLQTYGQLLPGRSPPPRIALREEDWVECEEMVNFINRLPENHEIVTQIQTEPIVKRCFGYLWPSSSELSEWYKNRARDIDSFSGQLDNCIDLIDLACRKGIYELQKFHEDILLLHQLIYSDENDVDVCSNLSLISWEQLSEYEKFRMMLKGVKEENVVKRLHDKAIPFMRNRFHNMTYFTQDQGTDCHFPSVHENDSFLVKWLKEIALENKLDTCLMVIEEGCRELHMNGFFKDEIEAVDCALQCIYLCTVTDRWSIMADLLSKLPQKQDVGISIEHLEKRLKLAEGHIEAGRLLALYQVPKPMNFFLEAHADEKGVKQILRLILSKFVRRQPGRSDNDWANMWHDVQCLREKAFPFLDPEYMLVEFCRGLLKAGKFSLARNYLKGTSSVALASEKAENLVIQAAREYFFSASSLSCSEIWKAKECLNLFPSSRNVQTEADLIDALTVKLPYLGVTLLPLQFRQIKDPIEIIKMAITSQAGAYLHVDELIEVAKLLGLNSSEDLSTVQEAIAREAAVAGDLQLAFDLCLVLTKKGHGHVWDLCAAIARGPALENIDIGSRKHLLGFALSHCDEESIGELLHAWKDLDMQGQCETLSILTGTSPSSFSDQGSSITSPPAYEETIDLKDYSELDGGASSGDREVCFSNIKNTLSFVTKNCRVNSGTDLESFLWENGKLVSFATIQLPWLLELSKKADNGKKFSTFIPGKHYVSIKTQAVVTILSWLAKNDYAPRDDVIASLAKSIIEPPVTVEEDIMGCSILLNLVDAFSGVEIIEEQLRIRKNYQEICSIMNVGMTYSLLHNSGVECKGPAQRRELLLRKFKEKHKPPSSDDMTKIDVQSTFWGEWKFKLEEKKRVAEQSRVLEKIIPGVETGRFLSGDLDYIKSTIFSLIESVKFEKKHIIKDVLRLVDAYGLNHTEVLLRYLSSILVSEVWTDDDDVKAEISEVKGEIISFGSETIKTISLVVYPTIDGCNKQRLAYIYGLLSDCYLRLGESKEPSSTAHPNSPNLSALDVARLYKVFEQECQRVSFIKNLDFKNVAGLDGLNLQSFKNEVFSHVNESSLEALAKMVQTLASIYADSLPEGLIVWQDVYKHYTMSLLTTLESRVRKECDVQNAERFQEFMSQLEQTYDFCRTYMRLLSPSDSLDIMKRYFTVIMPLHSSHEIIPDNSTWQDCVIILLNFWLKLTEEMQEIALDESSVGTLRFDPEFLSSCLKVFMRMVMEDSVSPSQAWGTVIGYASSGLIGDFSVEIPIFCRAMLYSGCGFGAISEVFLESMSICAISSASTAKNESLDLPHLYVNMLELILKNLVGGSQEHQNLYHLLSSLSKLEGQIEDLQRVRHVVWERMAQFSDNLELPSHVRVYVLEIMQFITGRSIKGFSTELNSNLLPWEGWDGLLSTGKKSNPSANQGSPDHTDNSSRFTSTLVALRSSQLASAISPSIAITPDDLFNVETAVSCFLKLCGSSSTEPHFDALIGILEEWEGFFVTAKDEVDTTEATETGNDWNNDDWDEGWESFQEVEALEKEKPENSNHVHPLHVCWMEIFKKLITSSKFKDVLRLIDCSLSKSYGILLDEDDARSLSHTVLEKDSFMALKMVLLLPYEAIQLQCLVVVEDKLKQGRISGLLGRDHEILMLVLSSGVISNIITKPSYGTTFSYLCYVVGNFSRQSQESQLSTITNKGANQRVNIEKDVLLLFIRIMFPCFISELVKTDQLILAGFLITKFMHTNPSFSLVNTTESSLSRYLERQLHALQQGDHFSLEEISSFEMFRNTVSRLTIKLGDSIRSALPLLSSNAR